MFIPILDQIEISGKTITADALLTQKKLAEYIVGRGADYLFTAKQNQSTLYADIKRSFVNRKEPDCCVQDPPAHGRIDTRSVWVTSELNKYLKFPHVGQAFCIHKKTVYQKSGKIEENTFYGITSHSPEKADPARILQIHRGQWTIENSKHYILDWTYDEDRTRIRTGNGPANTNRLRGFAIGLLKSREVKDIAQKVRDLHQRVRLVFDYLKMTKNSRKNTTT
ncbi:MAG: ISAs1 family transposase [Desulfovermiculus sp.]|nr:ISAs1 family transposase [Desulfovermiculus sp.]